MPRQTTFVTTPPENRPWHLCDAEGVVLGHLATEVATILMGKHRPEYTPHVDTGDFVVVVNAEKVVLTGQKERQRTKLRYSGYPGGLKATTFEEVRRKHPERLVEDAVRRMLPKSRLGRAMYAKLKVYAGPDHPHHAQQPEALTV